MACLSDQRLVAALVALALTDSERLVFEFDEQIDAELTLTLASAVAFNGFDIRFLLEKFAAQILKRVLSKLVKGRVQPWSEGRKAHGVAAGGLCFGVGEKSIRRTSVRSYHPAQPASHVGDGRRPYGALRAALLTRCCGVVDSYARQA